MQGEIGTLLHILAHNGPKLGQIFWNEQYV